MSASFYCMCHANYQRSATPGCGSAAIGAGRTSRADIDEDAFCTPIRLIRKQRMIMQYNATGRFDLRDAIVDIFQTSRAVSAGHTVRCPLMSSNAVE
jgi:hypothetical protein